MSELEMPPPGGIEPSWIRVAMLGSLAGELQSQAWHWLQ